MELLLETYRNDFAYRADKFILTRRQLILSMLHEHARKILSVAFDRLREDRFSYRFTFPRPIYSMIRHSEPH